MLSLTERGYGVDQGIPTLVIAASSIDDVIAITGFGVALGMAFSIGTKEIHLSKTGVKRNLFYLWDTVCHNMNTLFKYK